MCGFLGYASSQISVEPQVVQLNAALDTLEHRGPDASGHFNDNKVYLGHRRLSIIDLSTAANQPLKSNNAEAQIIFNGEVYNYQELRQTLTGLTTDSDTEVLLEGYLKEGVDFFKKLRGIFAFAIYDYRDQPKVVLYRDLAGIKPLYYLHTSQQFIFGSEIKAVKAAYNQPLTTNEAVLKSYLCLGYCIEPQTIYQEVLCVEPGMLVELDLNSGAVTKQALNRYELLPENKLSFEANAEQTQALLQQAVKRNLIADVELSTALSGGIDSSLIYALSNQDQPNHGGISVKFNDQAYDETDLVKVYADTIKAPVDIIETSSDGNLALLDKLLLHFDQPYSDSSAIPFYFLSKKASERTKVLIGGDGGDEIHNGYPSMPWLAGIHKIANNPLINGSMALGYRVGGPLLSDDRFRQVTRLFNLTRLRHIDDISCEWQSWFSSQTQWDKQSPFKFDTSIVFQSYHEAMADTAPDSLHPQIIRNYFYKRMLSDYLRKSDMMSMINSIEYRVPMLDEDLVAFSLTVPFKQKASNKETKKILRYLHRQIYPEVTSKAPKSGFSIPLDKWLSTEDYRFIQEYLCKKDGIVLHYIKEEYIHLLFESLLENKHRRHISRASTYQRILTLYSLQLWYFNQ